MRKLIAMCILAVLASGSLAYAQASVGVKYGARDPRSCTDTKSPRSGPISAVQATKYVTCSQEGILSGQLYLVENVKVTVGAGRPYNSFSDSYATSIDTAAPVYPIRGGFNRYQCDVVSKFMENTGKNCNLYRYPKSEGKCFKTTYGDWYCDMQDLSNPSAETAIAPPGGVKISVSQDKPVTPRQPAAQTTVKGSAAGDDKNQNSLPKPDFSAMQKYFDISEIKYDLTGGALYFTGKITQENNAVDWVINFYDSNGVKVIDTNGVNILNGDHYEVGDTAKYYFYLPPQSLRNRISRVVITKKVY